MFAEAYALNARFHVPYPSLDYYGPLDECRTYASFVRDNEQAYLGAQHVAEVAVLFSYTSGMWDYWTRPDSQDAIHNRQWYGLCQALTDMSIQYDVAFAADGKIIVDTLEAEDLLSYPVVVVPWAYSLSDEQVQLLEALARSGRRLIVIGDVATVDEEKNQRSTIVADALKAAGASVIPDLNLETYLDEAGAEGAKSVRNEVRALFPNQMVTVFNDSTTAMVNRAGESFYCHLINRGLTDSGFTPQRDVRVRLILPADLQLASGQQAIYLSPDASGSAPAALTVSSQGRTVEFTVPSLEVYGVVEIACSLGS
jgi:hypothetical protein